MTTNPVALAGTFLVEGGAVAFAVWELWKLRPRKDDKPDAPSAFARTPKEEPSPEPAGHPEREHGPDDG
jgi:hypothetical protein